eukprot:scaffold426565_cov50-Prasinocladus_malaysianus.AAC.1
MVAVSCSKHGQPCSTRLPASVAMLSHACSGKAMPDGTGVKTRLQVPAAERLDGTAEHHHFGLLNGTDLLIGIKAAGSGPPLLGTTKLYTVKKKKTREDDRAKLSFLLKMMANYHLDMVEAQVECNSGGQLGDQSTLLELIVHDGCVAAAGGPHAEAAAGEKAKHGYRTTEAHAPPNLTLTCKFSPRCVSESNHQRELRRALHHAGNA